MLGLKELKELAEIALKEIRTIVKLLREIKALLEEQAVQ